MKHISLLVFLTLMMFGNIYGASQRINHANVKLEKDAKEFSVQLNGKTLKHNPAKSHALTRADQQGHIVTPLITEPSGNSVEYSKESIGITTNWMLGSYVYQGSSPSIVVFDGDDVYIKNIISEMNIGTYVKGKIMGDRITMELPQTIQYYDEMDFGYNVAMLKIDTFIDEETGEEYLDYFYDDSITSVDFIMGDDGYFYLDLPGEPFDWEYFPEYALGVVYTDIDPYYDGQFIGYCDFTQEYSVFEMEANKMPEGINLESYVITDDENGFGYTVYVGFDGNDVYFQGLSNYMPEGIVKGEMKAAADGSSYIVTIPQNQYLGIFDGSYFIFTKAVTLDPDYEIEDPNDLYVDLAPEDAVVELIYNPETKTFTYGDSPYLLCLNTSLNNIYYLQVFLDLNFKYQAGFAGIPQDPMDLVFIPFAQFYGYDVFDFTIPNLSTDGTILEIDNLYYSVFIDGDIMEFEEEEGYDLYGDPVIIYEGIKEPTDLLPLTFNNDRDIWSNGTLAEIGIYSVGFTTLGVQSVYIYEGVTTKSNIVTYNIETGEINSVDSLAKDMPSVENIEFYDLNGYKISHPDKGIYLMKTTLSNGKTLVKKIAKR